MKYRKLRIAWTVAWGVVAVLLCVLWVRNCWFAPIRVLRFSDGVKTTISAERSVIIYSRWDVAGQFGRGSPWVEHGWKLGNYHPQSDFGKPMIVWKQYDLRIRIPTWLPLSLSAAFGIVPWIRWSRRFSLRTLLIATTLVAVALSLIVYAGRQ
jgi:hypothetical protein